MKKAYQFFLVRMLFGCVLMLSLLLCQGQQYLFQQYSTADGLAQSQPNSITQDGFGRLWIGTIGGLSVFNGSEFMTYTKREGLISNHITDLATDKKGNLWIATMAGMSRFNGQQFETIRIENSSDIYISKIAVDKNNNIWAITGNSNLVFFPPAKLDGQLVSFLSQKANTLSVDRIGTLWVGDTSGNLFYLENNKWQAFNIHFPEAIRQIYFTHSGKMMVLTYDQLFCIENGKQKTLLPNAESKKLNLAELTTIQEGNNSSLWIGTGEGLIHFQNDTVTIFNESNGYTKNTTLAILKDKADQLWFATNGSGLYKFNNPSVRLFKQPGGREGESIFALAKQEDSILIGTNYGLYFLLKDKIQLHNAPGAGQINIAALLVHHKRVLIGTRDGNLHILANNRLFSPKGVPLRGGRIYQIIKDKKGRIWIGTSRGLFYSDDGIYINEYKKNFFVTSMHALSKDTLVVGTPGQLHFITGNGETKRTHPLLDGTHIIAMTSYNGSLVLGTGDNGVLIYDLSKNKVVSINTSNGLGTDLVYSLQSGNSGVWIGTGKGVEYLQRTAAGWQVKPVGGVGGSLRLEAHRQAMFKDEDNNLWVGTEGGLLNFQNIKYKPEDIEKPLIYITGIKLFSKQFNTDSVNKIVVNPWFNIPEQLVLSHHQNHLTFEFNAHSLLEGNKIKYQYLLSPVDSVYSSLTLKNFVIYSNLQPGVYEFKVRAYSNYSNQSSQSASYHFTIKTPFYKTILFRILLVILILLGVVLLSRTIEHYRLEKKKAMDKMREEELQKLRQQTAEDFHDEIGNKLTRITLLAQVLASKTDMKTDANKRILDQLQQNAQSLYGSTKEVIWSLDPKHDNLYDVLHHMENIARDAFADTDINFEFTGLKDSFKQNKLPLENSRNLIMIFKESISNIIKYAKADQVNVVVKQNIQQFSLQILDNGNGFDIMEPVGGSGVHNMHKRVKRIGGSLHIYSEPQLGTRIEIDFPLNQDKI
jgi:signal transduction histidine kinase/ligand-binding sensor domain-containing protein